MSGPGTGVSRRARGGSLCAVPEASGAGLDGGIGIRGGLKHRWLHGLVGSSPTPGTVSIHNPLSHKGQGVWGFNMGTTNTSHAYLPGEHEWGGGLLPFFKWFIQGGGFERWHRDLIGTEEERGRHPFLWSYDPETEVVRREDREVKGGKATITLHEFSISDALESLIDEASNAALSDLRALVARSGDPVALLTSHLHETESLVDALADHESLRGYPSVLLALKEIERQTRRLSPRRLKSSRPGGRGRGVHQQNREWIVREYHNLLREEGEEAVPHTVRGKLEGMYKEEFGISIDESAIRRALGEKE